MMIHTPEKHIPIGNLMCNESGELCIEIKKAHSQVCETIKLSTLFQLMLDSKAYNRKS